MAQRAAVSLRESGKVLRRDAGFVARHVLTECPKASSKKIVKASLLALSDPDVKDAQILQVVYALAIRHRLDPVTENDFEPVAEPSADRALVKKRKRPKT